MCFLTPRKCSTLLQLPQGRTEDVEGPPREDNGAGGGPTLRDGGRRGRAGGRGEVGGRVRGGRDHAQGVEEAAGAL